MIRSLFFMILIMMVAGTSLAEDISPCSVDMVPIQIITETKYLDVTTLSVAKIRDYPEGFAPFVTAVTKHLAARLAHEKLCLDSAESREQSLLQFVPRRVTISDSQPVPSVPPLESRPLGVCRISSPWIDLAIERKPVPRINGIVRWSQRQLLADQAVLDGARNVPPGVAEPMKGREHLEYVLEYINSYEFTSSDEYALLQITGKPVGKPIEERIPPDLLWGFRRSWQATPFTSAPATRNAMKAGAESYTKIVTTLIDRCFESDGIKLHYDSILDVDDPVLLEQYKIVTPIR